jgi:hypothetical protein
MGGGKANLDGSPSRGKNRWRVYALRIPSSAYSRTARGSGGSCARSGTARTVRKLVRRYDGGRLHSLGSPCLHAPQRFLSQAPREYGVPAVLAAPDVLCKGLIWDLKTVRRSDLRKTVVFPVGYERPNGVCSMAPCRGAQIDDAQSRGRYRARANAPSPAGSPRNSQCEGGEGQSLRSSWTALLFCALLWGAPCDPPVVLNGLDETFEVLGVNRLRHVACSPAVVRFHHILFAL